jgi:general secretion pathway protein A
MSTPAWLSHFGFREPPFSREISDADLWLPPSKAALVDDLTEALSERASVLLTGDPGVGKTCVLRALKTRLPQAGFRLTYCHNATLGRRDFYRQLCLALGLTPSATAAALFYAISSHVQDLGKDKIHPIFLLDEAHLLHQDTLDHLHILLNYNWDSRALLSLLLVGLPELQDRLALRRNRSLYSRIHHRFTVGPLTVDDTAAYLALRLQQAGGPIDLFAHEALSRLHESTGGILRDKKRRTVDADLIDRIIDAVAREAA